MTLVIASACRRCGCFTYENDPVDGLTCLLCARPFIKPDTAGIRLVREDAADIGSIIAREQRSIRAAAEAGRRAWS